MPSIKSSVFTRGASGGVYQNHTVLHLLYGIKLNHMIGGIHQGAVQGNQITFCQKLFQRNIFHEILQGGIFVNIIGDYLHA